MRVTEEIDLPYPITPSSSDSLLSPELASRAPALRLYALEQLQTLIGDSLTPSKVRLAAIQELASWVRMTPASQPQQVTTKRRSIEVTNAADALRVLRSASGTDEEDPE